MEHEDRSQMPRMDQKLPVWLCCSEADAVKAEAFRQMLEESGIPCVPELGHTDDVFDAVMDCGCVLILVSEQAESCQQIDMAIVMSLAYDVPMGFVYLEDCTFTALPVDNADQIPVCRAGDQGTDLLMQYLEAACSGSLAVQYEEESFGSETVKNRISRGQDAHIGAMALGWGPSPLIGQAIIVIIAIVLALLFKSKIAEITTDLLHAAGFVIP